jgi:1-acyl-sn-glycerol-3-phosphate acyltransferase
MSAPLRTTIVSVWTWFVLGFGIALAFPFVLLWRYVGWPVDRRNYWGGRLFRKAGAATEWFSPWWRFEVRGTPPANPRNPYVVVANHESFADILLLCHLPWEMKWMSKQSIMRIPVLGWAMWAVRDIPITRERATSARDALAASRDRLDANVSVVIFPEGTRSETDEMLPFKDGAFRLAIEAQVPILPLALYGTRDAIAKHDWRINPAQAVVEILDPIPTAGLGKTDLRALKEQVRAAIDAKRSALRAELAQRTA